MGYMGKFFHFTGLTGPFTHTAVASNLNKMDERLPAQPDRGAVEKDHGRPTVSPNLPLLWVDSPIRIYTLDNFSLMDMVARSWILSLTESGLDCNSICETPMKRASEWGM
jgi:hypothetical protein